jgi:hypothetical protein
MKRGIGISSLLVLGLCVVVVMVVVPGRTARADDYVQESWEEFYGWDDYVYDQNDGFNRYFSGYGDAREAYAECSAEASGDAWISNGSGSFSGWGSGSGWGYAYTAWVWQSSNPNQTPPGGTLSYSFDVSGYAQADGDSSRSTGGSASAGSGASSSGSAGGGGDGSASGGVSNNDLGTTSASASPGDTTEIPSYGYYYASSTWGVDDSDDEVFGQGTTYVSFGVSADCDADASANASATSSSASAHAYAGSSASASGDATFP